MHRSVVADEVDRWHLSRARLHDGHLVPLRDRSFESAAAAHANNERAEQGAWWSETETCFDGPVSFTDSEDAEEFLAGGSKRCRRAACQGRRMRC